MIGMNSLLCSGGQHLSLSYSAMNIISQLLASLSKFSSCGQLFLWFRIVESYARNQITFLPEVLNYCLSYLGMYSIWDYFTMMWAGIQFCPFSAWMAHRLTLAPLTSTVSFMSLPHPHVCGSQLLDSPSPCTASLSTAESTPYYQNHFIAQWTFEPLRTSSSPAVF